MHLNFASRAALAVLPFAAMLAIGCASDAAGEDEAIKQQVRALGFTTEAIEVDGDIIRVDDDIILSVSDLLDGNYGPALDDEDETEKGYKNAGLITANWGNIKLVFDTTPASLQFIKDAYINAAGDINSTTGSKIRISQNNTGPTIAVHYRTSLWPTSTTCDASSASCATWPTSGKPGAHIYVKTYAPGGTVCPNWTSAALANRARHELLHTLGMRHPVDGVGTWISGTAKCTNSDQTTCQTKPSYSTVMTAGTSACSPAVQLLQTDDKASIKALYPAP